MIHQFWQYGDSVDIDFFSF